MPGGENSIRPPGADKSSNLLISFPSKQRLLKGYNIITIINRISTT